MPSSRFAGLSKPVNTANKFPSNRQVNGRKRSFPNGLPWFKPLYNGAKLERAGQSMKQYTRRRCALFSLQLRSARGQKV